MVKIAQHATEIATIWQLLEKIPDPEIPVLSITDLGIVRDVKLDCEHVVITITPTYTGCPAMNTFEQDITQTLNNKGWENVIVNTVYEPAWTTDWINDAALTRLKEYGIAPPVKGSNDKGILFSEGPKTVECPHCNSTNTVVVSQFGSTACKALYKCNNCLEPFDYFKCI